MAGTFKHDHILRDANGVPIARVIFPTDNFELGKPLQVAVLIVSAEKLKSVKNIVFYADEFKYKIPANIPDQKIMLANGKLNVNSFVMEIAN